MYGKILIQCDLIVRTGMHIGASGAFSAIGAVDSPVVRDTLTGNPIVPGSSLKGKLRTLLARSFSGDIEHMPNFKNDEAPILRLFGSAEAAVGQSVRFDGNVVKVVGVLQRRDKDELKQGGPDDRALLPYTTALLMNQNADVSEYIITVDKVEEIAAARILLTVFLQGRYKSPDYFYISSMSEMLKSMESTMSMMSAALGGIAGISLLVAGVGVMNIMLVSVTERTREIGIRKSLGAKKTVILQQFVIEAAVTSSIGGLVGIALGCVITPAAGSLMHMKAAATLPAVLVSFGVSAAIGLVFGYMPARRAAGLNPIDALRSE